MLQFFKPSWKRIHVEGRFLLWVYNPISPIFNTEILTKQELQDIFHAKFFTRVIIRTVYVHVCVELLNN
jgi:hypothetical protein